MALRTLLLALIAGIAAPGLFILAFRSEPATASAVSASRVLPDFALEDQRGRLVTTDELRRVPVVVSFFFTSCNGICPMTAGHLVRLQQATATEDVAFVSFSIDPVRDDRSARSAYAARWAPNETRWYLLAPTVQTLGAIAASLGMATSTAAELHSTAIILLAPGGRVHRVWSAGTSLADEVAALYSLARASDTISAQDGPTLYRRYGCAGCHEQRGVAPDLRTGGPYTVDGARRALVSPSAEITPGFRDTMPSYAEALSDRQLEVLGEWLSALRAEPTLQHRPIAGHARSSSIDPVCGMEVEAWDSAPHASMGGVDHWFCSETCRRAYISEPGRYATKR